MVGSLFHRAQEPNTPFAESSLRFPVEGQDSNISQACKKIGVSEQTYYRWRREYGGMQVEQAKRLKNLEKENSRLKKLVADLSLDNSILKEVNKGNF